MKRLGALLLLGLLAGCGPDSGDIDRTIDLRVGGVDRTFDLFVPAGVLPPVPLVVVFHGFGSNPDQVRRTSGLDAVARERGFAVVYPRAIGLVPAWRADPAQGDADLSFFPALLDAVAEVTALDRSAVLVAGFSNGGGMAVRLGCELSDRVIGVVAVAAALDEDFCVPERPIPLLAFHGTEDVIVPYPGTPGYLAPVEAWVAGWAAAAGCEARSTAAVAADVAALSWSGCEAPVTLYTIAAGGHGWPGAKDAPARGRSTDSIDASALIGDFLEALR